MMAQSPPTYPNKATVTVSAETVKEFAKQRKLRGGFYRLSCMKGPLRLLWTQHRGKDDGMKNNVAFWGKCGMPHDIPTSLWLSLSD
ncbi:unnamed protein product [Sphenostylis stenocarpa]|uniref:Uncharacterized protein n=1 Tax=Sphenostylis stenocarpa TaxID=92480 RepID=A0AA86SR52_9FABA|nr:unnamed protein product [Sphenostylis stenocarpa]